MKHLVNYIVFCSSILTSASAVNKLNEKFYYNAERQVVELMCRSGGNPVTWNSEKHVVWYTNEDKSQILYNSSSHQKFPFVEKTRDNKTVFLRHNNGKGWTGNGCVTSDHSALDKIAGLIADLFHNTHMTIPYFYGPNFRHEPSGFQLNTTYTLWCDGSASPYETMTLTFWLNNTAIATVKDRDFTDLKAVKGLKIAHNFEATNNSIFVIPSLEEHKGFYGCNFTYPGSNINLEIKSGNWSTSDGISTSAIMNSLLMSFFVVVSLFFTANQKLF